MNQTLQTARAPILGRFANAQRIFAHMDADIVSTLVTAAADVVLVMDESGVIQDAAFGSQELLNYGCLDWLGKHWGQTVTEESIPKITAMLKDIGGT
jgi:PAS domain-containing protein